MNFTDEFRQWLERSGGITSAMKRSHDVFEGSDKKFKMSMHSYKEKHLRPGNFYSLNYHNPDLFKLVKTGEAKVTPYYDSKPLVMSLGFDGIYETCLNLNVLSIQKRLLLFNFIYKGFPRLITENLDNDRKDNPAKYNVLKFNKDNIKSILGVSTSLSIYNYDRQYIDGIKAIDWDSTVMLSTLYVVEGLIINPKSQMNYKKLQLAASA